MSPIEVRVGSILFAYTGGQERVEAEGSTLGELLEDLGRRHPGLYHRIVDEQRRLRPHVAVFLDRMPARDLAAGLGGVQQVHLLGALSGG